MERTTNESDPTILRISKATYADLERLRLTRAERSGNPAPSFAALVEEAFTLFRRHEWAQPVMWTPKPGERRTPTR